MTNERPWFVRYSNSMIRGQNVEELKRELENEAGYEATVEVLEDETKIIFDRSKPIEKQNE